QGDYRQMGSGLSSYYPYDGNIESFAGYAAQNAAPLPQKCLYYYLLYGELPKEAEALLNGDVTGNEGVNIPVEKPSQRLYDIAMLEDLPVDVDSEGYAFVTLSEGQMNQLSSIHFQLMYMNAEDDIILHLGSDSNIIADWETGIFKDNFNGMWPMLDGHPVYVEITAEEDGYNLYSVPIKLNGVECNLMVAYIFADNSYKILGARKGIDEYGMGDRNLIKLKEGDTITTIHYAMTMSGAEEEFSPVEVDNFQIGSQPVFADENMGDGEYGYCFEFVSPTVDSALSQMVQFTVKDNKIVTTVE
ncbi:MAG: clostripain, partial [Anaerovibrio sp.]|nr:clostripain [Anaerovibrio sp.]